jgi:hypothetical protein
VLTALKPFGLELAWNRQSKRPDHRCPFNE